MSQPAKFEKIKELYGSHPKPMMVNLEIAKIMPFKTQTRRLKTKWKVGDVLWVREPVEITNFLQTGSSSEGDYAEKIWYKYPSDGAEDYMDVPDRFESTPSYMKNLHRIPNGCIKEMARTFLREIDVREEFLQDISQEDAKAEGASQIKVFTHPDRSKKYLDLVDYIDNFKIIWNSTAPKGSKWEDNPKVKVIVFEEINL